ncbi:hypothetical protein [Curtobacterium sp. MCBA15_004]|uniref:hypothetical protein n=1 Tax=Curtobacterium sp. MCBA15_004 TaxID=1898733 RepID=UPI0008DC9FFA|nr:hypothetical protein [Curtobacterium sp. MCBA15_004]WIA96450.1 hypothetical protein QOL16_15330 [Curtobacterium sp. MCBA15_004]
MTSNYPKSYVLDRIGARRVSLQAKQKIETATIAAAEKVITDDYAETLPELTNRIKDLLAFANKSKLTGEMPKDQQVIARIREEAQKIGNPPYRMRHNERPADVAQRDRTAAKSRLADITRELDALEHTEAYLRGTPVDEFSLTSLKRLGLLEAIKFNLDDAMKAGSK